MERRMKLFVIPKERVPSGPPNPAREIALQADSLDGFREAARQHVESEKLKLRSVSNGPNGIVAYAEEIPA
ncbi:MAG: hypothetical protein JXR76_14740 [Deltaproteobacteria bacterium]|nr:hypothetical protein [Deltaproteobacteria bacterium]